MIKTLIFDIDETLICKKNFFGGKQHVSEGILDCLKTLKLNYDIYLSIASFNFAHGEYWMGMFFPGIFDSIVLCRQHDCSKFSKRALLQKIRKEYSVSMKINKLRSTKLKWKEMVFFDDNPDVIESTQKDCPTLTCVHVVDGVTKSFLEFITKNFELQTKI